MKNWKKTTRRNYQKQYQISRENEIQQKLFKFTIFSGLLSTLLFRSARSGSKQLPSVYLFSFFWHIKRKIKFIKTKSCVFFRGELPLLLPFASNSKQWNNNNNKFILRENLKRLQFLLFGESFLHTSRLLLLLKCLLTSLETVNSALYEENTYKTETFLCETSIEVFYFDERDDNWI